MGDSSVSRGVNGGHSVVSWKIVDLEDTRWFIHMSGTLAGMSGRLDSTGTVHQSTMCCLSGWWSQAVGFLIRHSGLQEAQEALA